MPGIMYWDDDLSAVLEIFTTFSSKDSIFRRLGAFFDGLSDI